MFNVISLDTNELIKAENGNALSFDNGNSASLVAIALTEQTGKKHQVRRAKSTNDWREREAIKFTNGEYEIPEWMTIYSYVPFNQEHFVHVSKRDPSKIAFTQDADKGERDIQTIMRVGSYLKQYTDLSDTSIRDMALMHANKYAKKTMHIAETADDIERVFTNGPNSCMSKDASRFASSCHPVRVYGDSDIALAYLKDDDDNITARSLIYKSAMIHNRIYGDYERLKSCLIDAGYNDHGSFNGAYIRKIICDDNNRLVLPYLDGVQALTRSHSRGDDWLKISDQGDIYATNTDGLESGAECEQCGDSVNQDDVSPVYVNRRHTRDWCSSCRDEHAFYCDGIGETVSNDCEITVNYQSYSSWYVHENATFCEFTNEYSFDESSTEVITYFRGKDTTKTCFDSALSDHAFECRITKEYYANEYIVTDVWSDLPRCVHVYPTDVPSWFIGEINFRDHRQLEMVVNRNWSGETYLAA